MCKSKYPLMNSSCLEGTLYINTPCHPDISTVNYIFDVIKCRVEEI